MAKTKGPLFSESAHGTISHTLTHSSKKAGHIVRKYHYPKKDPSGDQLTQRTIIGLLTAHWQVMSAAEKTAWNVRGTAESPRIPGFAKFIKDANADLKTYHGLLAYWSMNEKTGAQILDYSGGGHHGALKPSYPTNCPARVAGQLATFGNALHFDAVDDEIQVPYSSAIRILDNTPRTYILWFRITSYPSTGTEWSFIKYDDYGINMRIQANGKTIVKNPDIWEAVQSTKLASLTAWNMIAFTAAGNGTGHLILAYPGTWEYKAYSDVVITDSVGVLYFGGYGAGARFTGSLDDARMYNRVLTEEELKKQFALMRSDKKRQYQITR